VPEIIAPITSQNYCEFCNWSGKPVSPGALLLVLHYSLVAIFSRASHDLTLSLRPEIPSYLAKKEKEKKKEKNNFGGSTLKTACEKW